MPENTEARDDPTVTVRNQAEADERLGPGKIATDQSISLRIDPVEGPIDLRKILRPEFPLAECKPCGPDNWDGKSHGCENGHYSTCYLKSERLGMNVCLGCLTPVHMTWMPIRSVTVSGGENPIHPDWVRAIRDACAAAGVEFVFEGWGDWQQYDNRIHGLAANVGDDHINGCKLVAILDGTTELLQLIPGGIHHAHTPVDWFIRVGRERSGRMLDGRTWDEFPEVTNA